MHAKAPPDKINKRRKRVPANALANFSGLKTAPCAWPASNAAIVPVKPDYLSMAGTGQNLDYIRDMQERGGNTVVHSIVPTFCM